MNILVACEESQRVTVEFRKLGNIAFSCDLMDTSGEHPEWHIKGDCLPLLKENVSFVTVDGKEHFIDKWDMLIAFPPCTFLCSSGRAWFNIEKYGDKAIARKEEQKKAIAFFKELANAPIEKIAIENPIGIMSTQYRKPDQIIQPYWFGEPHRKSTCLWLKNLPKLVPTKIVEYTTRTYMTAKGRIAVYDLEWDKAKNLPADERRKVRSKTYIGVARAMAEQWEKPQEKEETVTVKGE